MTKRSGYRLHKGDQIATRPTTIAEIMSSPTFALGVADARRGRDYRRDYPSWYTNGQWAYERGRQWARLVPPTVVLKRNGKLTPEALGWGERVFNDIV